jgi:hypothetical protein
MGAFYIQGSEGVKILTGIVIITPGGLYRNHLLSIHGFDDLPIHQGIYLFPGMLFWSWLATITGNPIGE